MKRIMIAAIGLLFWGTPASAKTNPMNFDFDGDGIVDMLDNCSERANPMQDDTDADDCGNLCDADYDQSGAVGFGDFGYFTGQCFGKINPLCDHGEPIGDGVLGFAAFGAFTSMFGTVPGPSGPTIGTIARP